MKNDRKAKSFALFNCDLCTSLYFSNLLNWSKKSDKKKLKLNVIKSPNEQVTTAQMFIRAPHTKYAHTPQDTWHDQSKWVWHLAPDL